MIRSKASGGIDVARLFRRLCALVCALLLIGTLAGCEGEPPGDDNEFPAPATTYTEADFNGIRFRCTVSWETATGEQIEQELSKADSIALYNLLDRGGWTSPEADPPPSDSPILCLLFATGDTSKPKNCYGCVFLADTDNLVYTPSDVLGGLTPYVAPTGTYEAVWAKVSALTGTR